MRFLNVSFYRTHIVRIISVQCFSSSPSTQIICEQCCIVPSLFPKRRIEIQSFRWIVSEGLRLCQKLPRFDCPVISNCTYSCQWFSFVDFWCVVWLVKIESKVIDEILKKRTNILNDSNAVTVTILSQIVCFYDWNIQNRNFSCHIK